MPHRRKPQPVRRAMSRAASAAERNLVLDKRAIANFCGAYERSRCGRASCARVRTCIEPGAPCFDENREGLHDALLGIADLVDPDAEDDDEAAADDWWDT